MGDTLEQLEHTHSSGPVSACMPQLAQLCAAEGRIPQKDAAQLGQIFGIYMKGVRWDKMRMTASNRPSLASWQGWPWEWNVILPRSATFQGVSELMHARVDACDFAERSSTKRKASKSTSL